MGSISRLPLSSHVASEPYDGSYGKDVFSFFQKRGPQPKGVLAVQLQYSQRKSVSFSRCLRSDKCNFSPSRASGKIESKEHSWKAYFADPSAQVDGAAVQIPRASTSKEAVSALKIRLQQGNPIDGNMFVDVLQMCLKEGDLASAKEVHDCILKCGMEQNEYVINHLLRVYIRCGRMQDARQVFDKLVNKDILNWTTMTGGYAEHRDAKNAMDFYCRMRQEGKQPREETFLSILKACSHPAALEWGKEIHAHVRDAGLDSDVRVETGLVNMYVKCGNIDDARLVFEKMEKRNLISWTVMIGGLTQHGCGQEAFSLFLQMQREGFVPDATTFVCLLGASASSGALDRVKEVHRHAIKAGLATDLRVASALVHIYAKSGYIPDARLVFEKMTERNVVSWTVMIGGLAKHGHGQEAFALFRQMQHEGFVPDALTYVSLLSASASTGGALEWVKEVHSDAAKAGLAATDLRVGSALVHMYAKTGSTDEARLVFDGMVHRDVMSWNVMIGGLAQHGRGQEAFSLFLQMQREGFIPDETTCVSILSASASAGALGWVEEVHRYVVKKGLVSDLRLGNALVHMYATSGSIVDARAVFDGMVHRDVMSWTVMTGGLAQHGRGKEALQLFDEMKSRGVNPDARSFLAVLSACSLAGLVDEGLGLFLSMTRKYRMEPAIEHYNCIVDLFGRSGRLEEAKFFIANMPLQPVGSTWRVLLGACRTYNNLQLAEQVASELFKLDPKDSSAYVLLSKVYAAAGKWDKVSSLRCLMQERGVRKELEQSWIEIDNKIHRFVVGESHPETKEVNAELDSLIEQLKTEGYVPSLQLVSSNINEEDKELALCSHTEKLAVAYGLLHTQNGKPVRVFKNLRVCEDCHTTIKLISRVTGRETVARDASRFHHFKDGVCSCGDHW